MSLVTRFTQILVFLIAALVITGGVIVPLPRGWFEIAQLNPWVWLLGGLTAFQWSRSRRSGAALPLVSALQKVVHFSSQLRRPARFLLYALIGFAVVATIIHSFRLYQMLTGYEDHGVIQHVLVRSWIKGPFQCETCPQGTFLADHLAFSLILVAPILGIFQRPEVLFLIQGMVLAAGTWVLMTAGPLRKQKELWAVAFFVMVCHSHFRHTWYQVDFREDHLAFLFLSLLIVGAYQRSWVIFFLGSLLSLLCKENIGFIVPFACVSTVLSLRTSKTSKQANLACLAPGLVTLISIAWVMLSFKVLMPYFTGGTKSHHEILTRLPGLGSTPAEVVSNLLIHPLKTLEILSSNILSPLGQHYLLLLLLPWAFFIRKGGPWAFAAIPGILMNLISMKPEQKSLQWHYELVIFPFLMISTLEGIRRSTRKELLIGLFLALAFSERWPGLDLQKHWPTQAQLRNLRWFNEIPRNGVLAAGFDLLGPPATRAELLPIRSFSPQNQIYNHAHWLALDTRVPEQNQLMELTSSSWALHSRSPDGQFVLLENLKLEQ